MPNMQNQEKTAILTHKVRNPQDIGAWLDIWNAEVKAEYDETENRISNSEEITINPSEYWKIPVNQIIPVKVSINNSIDPPTYPIYIKDDEDSYIQCNSKDDPAYDFLRTNYDFNNSDPYYFYDANSGRYDKISRVEDPIQEIKWLSVLVTDLENPDITYDNGYYIITFQEENNSSFTTTETRYNAIIQTNDENNLKGQIAVFSEETGFLVPLNSSSKNNTDDQSEKNKFLTQNNEWKFADEYRLNSQYMLEKKNLQPIIEFYNTYKDNNNNRISSIYETNITNWDNYFEQIFDENEDPIEDSEHSDIDNQYYFYKLKQEILDSYNNASQTIDISLSSIDPNKQNNVPENKGSFSLTAGTFIDIKDNTDITENNIDTDILLKSTYEISNSMPSFGFDMNGNNYHAGYIGTLPEVENNANTNLAFGLNSSGMPGWYTIKQLNQEGDYDILPTTTLIATYKDNVLSLCTLPVVTHVSLIPIKNEENVTIGYSITEAYHHFTVNNDILNLINTIDDRGNNTNNKVVTNVQLKVLEKDPEETDDNP